MTINHKLIKKCCVYATQAYEEDIPSAIRIDSKFTSTTVFVRRERGMDFVIFRGTATARDWATNLMVWPWRVNGTWVHAGFALAQRSVHKKIMKHLNSKRKTVIVGHSLGGALAFVMALRLKNKKINNKKFKCLHLITFGKPNTQVKSKKQHMEHLDTNLSVVAGSDLVTLVPKMLFGADAKYMIYHGNDGKDYLNPTKDFRDKDRKGYIKESISDHFMNTSYGPRMENLNLETTR